MENPTTTVAEYDAQRRQHSDDEGQPCERMAAPSCLRRDSTALDGSWTAPFWLKGNTLMVRFPGEHEKRATAESIATAFHSAKFLALPADTAARKAMSRVCEKAGDAHKDTARLVDFATRLPMSSKIVVLTEALSRKFWIQPRRNPKSIGDWCAAFGLPRRTESLTWLAGRVFDEAGMTGKQSTYRRAMFESEDVALAKVVERGTPAATAAYDASNSVSEAWGAYERTDPILRYRYLTTGEVARVTPVTRSGSEVVAALSTPFKVRAGEVMVISESDPAQLTRPVALSALGFDDTHGLIGTFSSPGKRSRSDAIPTLLGALAAHESVLITGSPYLSSGAYTPSVWRWGTSKGAESAEAIERDVPLDVSLAGAPTE